MINRNKQKEPLYRPRLEIDISPLEIVANVVSLMGMILIVVVIYKYWPQLPDLVPSHFGLNGQPDAWTSKNSLPFFALIPLALYILLTVIGRKPHLCNYSVRLTKDNAVRLYAISVKFLAILKMILSWLFVYIFYAIAQIGLGSSWQLDWGFVIFFAFLAAALFWYLHASYKNR